MSPDDSRLPLLASLSAYRERYPEEASMVSHYTTFVTEHDDCFERSQLLGHVTGSALIMDAGCERLLLTLHRKLGRWLQPGGHADGESDVPGVAMKEAQEESGLADIRFFSEELLDVDIHLIPERKGEPEHYHYDCRFLLQAQGSDEFIISDESHDLAWVPFDDILAYTDEASILRMISKTRQLLT